MTNETQTTEMRTNYGSEKIIYIAEDVTKISQFRNALFNIPELLKKHGLVRVTRPYIVETEELRIASCYYIDSAVVVEDGLFGWNFAVFIKSPTQEIARERKSQLRQLIENYKGEKE